MKAIWQNHSDEYGSTRCLSRRTAAKHDIHSERDQFKLHVLLWFGHVPDSREFWIDGYEHELQHHLHYSKPNSYNLEIRGRVHHS